MLETLARDQERPALAQEYAPTWQGPEGQRAPTASFSAHPEGLGIQPGRAPPTWRCQRRPRCSRSGCPHFPPDTRGRQDLAATPPTRRELWRPSRSQRERPIRPHPAHLTPTGPMSPPHQQPHIQPPKDTSTHKHSPHQLSASTATPSPPPAPALGRGCTHVGTTHSHSQRRPLLGGAGKAWQRDFGAHSLRLTQVHRPRPRHARGRRAPATHRPPGPTAAAGSRRCSRGRPRSGSPCCGWPSCAPGSGSSRDSPGGNGGHSHSLPTPAAPSRAPRGASGVGRSGLATSGRASPPPEVQQPPPRDAKTSPSSLPTAHSLAGVGGLHTPLLMGPSADSRRKEISAHTFCES